MLVGGLPKEVLLTTPKGESQEFELVRIWAKKIPKAQ